MDKLKQYGPSFQNKTLNCLVNDRDFLQQVVDIVKPEFFDNEANQWIVKTSLSYFRKHKSTPTPEVLKVELEKIPIDVLKVSVKEQLKGIYKTSDMSDSDYIKDTFVDFCKNQNLKSALLKSVDLLQMGAYNDIRRLIDKSLKAGLENDVGHEYNLQIEDRYREEARKIIPTPWDDINKLLHTGGVGGLGNGDLGIIAASAGGGKSWMLVALAAHAAQLGYNVLHYTLELGDTYVGKRYDACFTGIPISTLKENRDKIEELTKDLEGDIIIKEYPAGRASITTIEAHIDQCINNGFKPDMVIVDYADLLRGSNGKDKRESLDDIYTNLRGMAKVYEVPVWTASQANRSASREKTIQGDRIAESYGKIMIADFAMSLSRKAEDKENGTGRIHIIKNRYGPDGLSYEALVDASIGRFKIGDRTSAEDNAEESQDYTGFTNTEKKQLKNASQLFNFK